MSAYEDDAGMFGDALADMVTRGDVTDLEALAYMGGDANARRKIDAIIDRDAASRDPSGAEMPQTERIRWLDRHLPDADAQREYAQERTVVAVGEAIMERAEAVGFDAKTLAAKIHRKRLNLRRNTTLGEIADMLWACDLELRDIVTEQLGTIEVSKEDADKWHAEDSRER